MKRHQAALDFANYLESIASLYPGGMPVSLLEGKNVESGGSRCLDNGGIVVWGKSGSKLVFAAGVEKVFDGQRKKPFYGEGGTLLLSAATKGMKLNRCDITLIGVKEDGFKRGFFIEALKGVNSRAIIVFGLREARLLCSAFDVELPRRGEWGEIFGRPFLHTEDPKEAFADSDKKKLLWNDLKRVIKRFGPFK